MSKKDAPPSWSSAPSLDAHVCALEEMNTALAASLAAARANAHDAAVRRKAATVEAAAAAEALLLDNRRLASEAGLCQSLRIRVAELQQELAAAKSALAATEARAAELSAAQRTARHAISYFESLGGAPHWAALPPALFKHALTYWGHQEVLAFAATSQAHLSRVAWVLHGGVATIRAASLLASGGAAGSPPSGSITPSLEASSVITNDALDTPEAGRTPVRALPAAPPSVAGPHAQAATAPVSGASTHDPTTSPASQVVSDSGMPHAVRHVGAGHRAPGGADAHLPHTAAGHVYVTTGDASAPDAGTGSTAPSYDQEHAGAPPMVAVAEAQGSREAAPSHTSAPTSALPPAAVTLATLEAARYRSSKPHLAAPSSSTHSLSSVPGGASGSPGVPSTTASSGGLFSRLSRSAYNITPPAVHAGQPPITSSSAGSASTSSSAAAGGAPLGAPLGALPSHHEHALSAAGGGSARNLVHSIPEAIHSANAAAAMALNNAGYTGAALPPTRPASFSYAHGSGGGSHAGGVDVGQVQQLLHMLKTTTTALHTANHRVRDLSANLSTVEAVRDFLKVKLAEAEATAAAACAERDAAVSQCHIDHASVTYLDAQLVAEKTRAGALQAACDALHEQLEEAGIAAKEAEEDRQRQLSAGSLPGALPNALSHTSAPGSEPALDGGGSGGSGSGSSNRGSLPRLRSVRVGPELPSIIALTSPRGDGSLPPTPPVVFAVSGGDGGGGGGGGSATASASGSGSASPSHGAGSYAQQATLLHQQLLAAHDSHRTEQTMWATQREALTRQYQKVLRERDSLVAQITALGHTPDKFGTPQKVVRAESRVDYAAAAPAALPATTLRFT